MSAAALAWPVNLSQEPAIARRQLADLLTEVGWADDAVQGVQLAVHEAIVNAHRHAGGVRRATAGFAGDSLVVEVWDRGEGLEIPKLRSVPDTLAERGRGLFIMNRLATEIGAVRRDDGMCLILRFDPQRGG